MLTTGSALVTSQVRAAIEDHSTIQILTAMPAGAEEIAIVKASSDSGWNEQASLDYAVEELKKQAAKLGANAVVITGRDTSSEVYSVPVYNSSPIIGSSSVEIVQVLPCGLSLRRLTHMRKRLTHMLGKKEKKNTKRKSHST